MGLLEELEADYVDPPPWSEQLPEIPDLDARPTVWEEPRCECGHQVFPGPLDEHPERFHLTSSPELLADRFTAEWAAAQRHTARAWRAAAAMHTAVGARRGAFVGDDLALLTNTHPRTGLALMVDAVAAAEVPELLDLLEAGVLGEKHVRALLEEVAAWTDSPEERGEVLQLTLQRCRERGHWPTPGELRRRLRTVAIARDLTAARKKEKSVADKREVHAFATGIGAAGLTLQGPQVQVAQMYDAIDARARALKALPGNTRTLEQCRFDAACELLTVDAAGGTSSVPAVGMDDQPVTLTVRGVQISLLVPVSVAAGGDLELAELPTFGPVLPSTARELLAHAQTVQRITVDAGTGQVLTLDPPLTVPTEAEDPGEATPTQLGPKAATQGEAVVAPALPDPDPIPARVQDSLDRVLSEPVVLPDLSTPAYRPPDRLRRMVERRDRTCTFPGCTVPGQRCDLDHREPWPHGPTSDVNLHCLCRHHHRAKQSYFTVTVDEDGSTLWTTPDGRRYRRPPPAY